MQCFCRPNLCRSIAVKYPDEHFLWLFLEKEREKKKNFYCIFQYSNQRNESDPPHPAITTTIKLISLPIHTAVKWAKLFRWLSARSPAFSMNTRSAAFKPRFKYSYLSSRHKNSCKKLVTIIYIYQKSIDL